MKENANQAILGEAGKYLPVDGVIVDMVAKYLDKRDILSLSISSKSALSFFGAARKSALEESKEVKKQKLEELLNKDELFIDCSGDDDGSARTCCCIVMPFGASLVAGIVSIISLAGGSQVAGIVLGAISTSTLLISSYNLLRGNLLLCKDIVIAEKDIEDVEKILKELDEISILIPEEENTEDNYKAVGLGYGTIN